MPPKKAAAAKKRKLEVEDDEGEDSSDDRSNDSESNGNDDDELEGDDDDDDNDDDDDDDDDDKSDEDEDDDSEKKSKKKMRSVTTKSSGHKKKLPPKSTSKSGKGKEKPTSSANQSTRNQDDKKTVKVKSLQKVERLEEARKAYKWWEAPELEEGINWKHLEHPGINFATPYERHNVPLLYNKNPVTLSDAEEELASFYAAMPDDGPQLGNPKTRVKFQKNFFDDFKEVLGASHVVQKFELCDFSLIRSHLDLQKSLRKAATDEEKQAKKKLKDQVTLKYGYAMIDGRLEKMGNFNMEPPGLFRGRGDHPKTGKVKSRCFSESVSINLSEDACIPRCDLPGHAWKNIQHDPQVTWLCAWNENVQNQGKYVMLSASSSFKGKSDLDKYGKAIQLKACIGKVRNDYTKKIRQDKDRAEAQLGVAMWVIDVLALRVGGEKSEEEADTVGCCSLRVEHLTFNADSDSHEIELEFLGKDSMLYKQNIDFAQHGDIGKLVYKWLSKFCKGKQPGQDVFETLSPMVLNKHLTSLMKGLSAKVFRTFNASITLERELPSAESLKGLSIQDKVIRYNAANRQVAILCNHQKTVSKATETMFENLNDKLSKMKDQLDDLHRWKKLAKSNKAEKIPLKPDDKESVEAIAEQILKATKLKEKAFNDQEKLLAAAKLEEAKALQKNDQKRRFEEKHKYKTAPTVSAIESRIQKWEEDINKLETDIRNRDENKEVALGTSKINYMDPRISVAWCKRCEVPIDKIFARTLRDKFNWAMAVPPTWKFE